MYRPSNNYVSVLCVVYMIYSMLADVPLVEQSNYVRLLCVFSMFSI